MMNPVLSKIRIYPIKSLDPVEVQSVKIGVRSLEGDRKYAMLADDGQFVNGKRTGRVNQLQASYDLATEHVTLTTRGSDDSKSFHLEKDRSKLEEFLSHFFQMKIILIQNSEGQLLDMPDVSSVTVVSQETLAYLASGLGESIDTLRLRFRTNLEIGNVPPYWEERLANYDKEKGVPLRIGNVNLMGIGLRARCNVPPRDPFTGNLEKSFIRRMIQLREKSIPAWSQVRRLGSLYHLTVNTLIPDSETGKTMGVGDEIELI